MGYFNARDVEFYKKSIVLEKYKLEKKATYQSFDVFLSHSSQDRDILPSIINFFNQYNTNLYIDKADDELPRKTSPATGEILKSRIQECNKFIVLVTQNSKDSKWIPWELGVADEKKTTKNVALLPVIKTEVSDWPEQEYLGLYPRITYETFKGRNSPEWMVLDQHFNNGIELEKWLS